MWISGILCLGLFIFSLFLTVWRVQWLRLVGWEEAFWRRAGVKPSVLRWLRKTEDNRWLIASVIALFALHLVLFVSCAGAYFYSGSRLKSKIAPRGITREVQVDGRNCLTTPSVSRKSWESAVPARRLLAAARGRHST